MPAIQDFTPAPEMQDIDREPPPVLSTRRPRVLPVDDSDDDEDSPGAISDSPNDTPLVFEDVDAEPELDDDLLEHVELSAWELLEGEFEREELRRGEHSIPVSPHEIF